MVLENTAFLSSPVAETDPCGPDLDFNGDNEFLSFFNDVSFALPGTFFGEDGPFNPNNVDFQKATEGFPRRLEALLKRSRDLRLLVFWAKFAALRRDIGAFGGALAETVTLLETQWDGVHPRAHGDPPSYEARARTLEALKEPVVAFSVQFMTLCRDKRRGDLSLRSKIAALREGEAPISEAQLAQSLQAAGADEMIPVRDQFERVLASLDRLRAIFIEKTEAREVPDFGKLVDNLKQIVQIFDLAFPRPKAAEAGDEEGAADIGGIASNKIRNAGDARRALECAIGFFVRKEPSSPALPLIAQARELFGKSFIEVLETLLPQSASNASFAIGEQEYFTINVRELSPYTPHSDGYGMEESQPEEMFWPEPEPEPPPAPMEVVVDTPAPAARTDGVPDFAAIFAKHDDQSGASASNTSDPNTNDPSIEGMPPEAEPPAPEPSPAEVYAPPPPPRPMRAAPPAFSAETRSEALALLAETATYLRAAEPANPIPWLIDRARALADKDFLSVLHDVLPKHALSRLGE